MFVMLVIKQAVNMPDFSGFNKKWNNENEKFIL